MKFGISTSPQSPDIEQNSANCISNFQISGQSLLKAAILESRDDIDIKLGPVTKLDKSNKQRQKKMTMTSCHDDNVMSTNCNVVIFPFYGQFGAIQKPGFRTHIR